MNDQTAEFGIQVYYFLIKGQIDSEFNLCHLFCYFRLQGWECYFDGSGTKPGGHRNHL